MKTGQNNRKKFTIKVGHYYLVHYMCHEEDKRIVKCTNGEVGSNIYTYKVLAKTRDIDDSFMGCSLIGLDIQYNRRDIVKEIPEDMLLIEMMKMQGE
jgi:hypothetical protein